MYIYKKTIGLKYQTKLIRNQIITYITVSGIRRNYENNKKRFRNS